jgi:hypothetical protein
MNLVGYTGGAAGCGILVEGDHPCTAPVETGTPLNLCRNHVMLAYDWASRDAGVTDILPSPCIACGSRLGVKYPSGWLCAICEWKVGEIPDSDFVTARVDVVYYIRYRDRIKIGTSGNPRGRLANIVHEEVLAFERGNRQLEQKRHRQFAANRLSSSEWFEVNDSLTAHIDVLRAGVEDPWSLYKLWVSQHVALHG